MVNKNEMMDLRNSNTSFDILLIYREDISLAKIRRYRFRNMICTKNNVSECIIIYKLYSTIQTFFYFLLTIYT